MPPVSSSRPARRGTLPVLSLAGTRSSRGSGRSFQGPFRPRAGRPTRCAPWREAIPRLAPDTGEAFASTFQARRVKTGHQRARIRRRRGSRIPARPSNPSTARCWLPDSRGRQAGHGIRRVPAEDCSRAGLPQDRRRAPRPPQPPCHPLAERNPGLSGAIGSSRRRRRRHPFPPCNGHENPASRRLFRE